MKLVLPIKLLNTNTYKSNSLLLPMIPKIIHQIWIGPKSRPAEMMNTWKDLHPEFEYIFWNEAEILKRRLQFKCMDKINIIPEINGKADIIRWEILYNMGGYFVDADSICIEPFDEYFEGKTAFATWENESMRKGLVATGTMGFVPGHPICRDIIDWIYSGASTENIKNTRAWYSVGPGVLTRFLESGKYPDFTVYPSHCFLPIHFTGPEYTGHKKVYGYQEWGTAKQSYDTMHLVKLPQQLTRPKRTVSVMITSYNTPLIYIRECLNSIKCQEGYFSIELIWVDDCSSHEKSRELVEELKAFKCSARFCNYVYIKNDTNRGASYSNYIGINACSQSIIFKMDSDDIMMPLRMKKQLAFMDANPECMVCGTNIILFKNVDEMHNGTKEFLHETKHPQMLTWNDFNVSKIDWFMNHPTLCYRKEAVVAVGNYDISDTRLTVIHDYDLKLRLMKKYGFICNLPDNLLMYRIHPGQLTQGLNQESAEYKQLKQDLIEKASALQ